LRGEVLASGILQGTARRVPIRPGMWKLLEVDYDFDSCSGNHLVYEAVEFFEPSAIPLNLDELPDWLRTLNGTRLDADHFEHDETYTHVRMGNQRFTLGPLQGKVIRVLHEAALRKEPWQPAKAVLHAAGSESMKLHDVFKSKKNWRNLIETDARKCRLRLP
jgi:hypothetical protein